MNAINPILQTSPQNTARYTDASDLPDVKFLKQVKDTLPRPEDLVLKPKTTKITLTLNNTSIQFFKSHAKKLRTSYQAMIRALIDDYVTKMEKSA